MKLSQLKTQVARLLFEKNLEDDESFFASVNRAIEKVRGIYPKIARRVFSVKNLKNLLGETVGITYHKIDQLSFSALDAKAYYFKCDGTGQALFQWYNPAPLVKQYEDLFTVQMQSDGEMMEYLGHIKRFDKFVNGEFRVIFKGDLSYSIKNLALYPCVTSYDENMTPKYDENHEIDLYQRTFEAFRENGQTVIKSGFCGLASPPMQTICGARKAVPYSLVEDKLFIPREIEGEIEVVYYSCFDTVGVGDDNFDLDVPKDVSNALSYLVAADLILEEDRELSNKYSAKFFEIVSEKTMNSKLVGGRISNVNNWC